MPGEFTVDLDEADKAVREDLPTAVELLRRPIGTLIVHEGFHRPGFVGAAADFETAYQSYHNVLGDRQQKACDAVAATAETLGEIIALYRRVDGQG